MTERRHVVVIYTDAGGGHRAAAHALREVLEATGLYRVTLVNPYRDLMPHLDMLARWTGRRSEDIYNETILRDGRTGLYCLLYYALVILNFRLSVREGRRILGDYFERMRPDMVITDLPMLNRVIFNALADYRARGDGREAASGVVLITDWTEIGRHVWFPQGRDYHAICGTGESYRRAASVLGRTDRVHRTRGLLLNPAFLVGPPADKAAARVALGFDPTRPVACMLYGAGGSWRMRQLALSLRDRPPDAQMVFMCGHNEALVTELEAIDWPFPARVVGFTREVPRYLGAADIFIGKPGPGSVSEALAFGLPLLLDRTMALPQERPVLRWVKRSRAGRTFTRLDDFHRALAELVAQQSAATAPSFPLNTAAAELPTIIGGILERDRDALQKADGRAGDAGREMEEGDARQVAMAQIDGAEDAAG